MSKEKIVDDLKRDEDDHEPTRAQTEAGTLLTTKNVKLQESE